MALHSDALNSAQSLSVNALPPEAQQFVWQLSVTKSISFLNSIQISFFWLGMGEHDPTCSLSDSPILHPSFLPRVLSAGLTTPD
jgi:hypothetical protein